MSEENKNVELKEEELEKVSGGEFGPDNVETYDGYSVGQTHTVYYSNGQYSCVSAEIENIKPLSHYGAPYYVCKVFNYIDGSSSANRSYWTKWSLDAFWNQTSE